MLWTLRYRSVIIIIRERGRERERCKNKEPVEVTAFTFFSNIRCFHGAV